MTTFPDFVNVDYFSDIGRTVAQTDVPSEARSAINAAPLLAVTGTYTRDGNGNITAAPDGSTYTWEPDGGAGWRVHTQTVGSVTRTFSYNVDGTIASVA